MNLEEKQLSFEYKFKGRIINLRVDEALLPNGATASREIVEHGGGICVVPLTENNEISIDCSILVSYGRSVMDVSASAQEAISNAVESTAGVNVSAVNVFVCGIVHQ